MNGSVMNRSVMKGSVMNVICCEWSVMNKSALNGHLVVH